MKERIYYSKTTGKTFGELKDERVDTRAPIKRNLADFARVNENKYFIVYERELPEQAQQLKPLLMHGQQAKTFYDTMKAGNLLDTINKQSQPQNRQWGYFRAVRGWVAFDNTGAEWKEVKFEDDKEGDRLCIEWFNS